MLIVLKNFGGMAPKVISPALLPDGKSQIATNCRFDKGGFVPLAEDKPIEDYLIPSTDPVIHTVTVVLDAPSGAYLVATTSEGDITGDGESVDIEVEDGSSTTISIVPGPDWWSLSLDGVEVYASSNDTKSYVLSNVTADHTVTISYYTPPM